MSSVAVKENQGVFAVRKNSSSEDSCDIFSFEQPTGRPSILRQSQADNINRTVPKGAKVCFQTPRRDPVTKRIMSPSRTNGINSQDHSTNALETIMPSADTSSVPTPELNMQSVSVSLPDDDIAVQSKGAYTLDLDNLDAMNPFQGSNKMANSPFKPSALPTSWVSELTEPDTDAICTPKYLEVTETPLEVTETPLEVTETPLEVTETPLEVTETPLEVPETPLEVPETPLEVPETPLEVPETPLEVPETPVTETPLDETLPFVPSVENSLADNSTDISLSEGTVIIKPSSFEKSLTDNEESDITEPIQEPKLNPVVEDQTPDSPVPRSGSYNLDFDNLESLDPFQTGGSKIPNSPMLDKTVRVSDPPQPSAEVVQEPEMLVQTSPTVPDAPSASVEKSIVSEASSSTTPPKENPMLLEFDFNDGAEVKRKPPPKRLGMKRPAGAKPNSKKTDDVIKEKKESEPKPLSPKNMEKTEPVDVPTQKGSYSFDDKLEDPNFNPFGTKAKMDNSPPRGLKTSPVLMEPPVTVEKPVSPPRDELSETPVLDEEPKPRSPQAALNSDKVEETMLSITVQQAEDLEAPIPSSVSQNNIAHGPPAQELKVTAIAKSGQDFQNKTCDLVVMTPSEDEFVPGALFMPGEDFDGQFDYLEQFGSNNFKESALRKQSLYLKFDPLLKESPKKMATENGGFSLPRPSLAFRMMEAAKSEGKQKSQCNSVKLLDDLPPPVVDTVMPDPTVLDLLVPTFKQPVKMEDSIIEVLKYSQKDMDAALLKVQKQAEDRQQQLNAQIEAVQLENQQMMFIVSEFEATITQTKDEHKQKEDLAKLELERVHQEKDQLARDLTDLERSFSSVVKRLDRSKEVIEGFKKNEQNLKQYAQNCMDRLQKEEKRYQALKAHAEEKLDHANKSIADVRTRIGAEVAMLQVQLKREQLKVQSLEKDLEQKAKEVKDVTELCDELLLKVQKHGF